MAVIMGKVAAKVKPGMNKATLVNYLLLSLIASGILFGVLYYFALSPDNLLYSIVPVTINKGRVPGYKFAFYGEGDHKIQTPMDLAISGQKVYISDAEANKIWIYDLNGKYLSSFGRPGNSDGELNFPYGIAVDGRNRVFVADMKNHRIQLFNQQGKFLSYFPNNKSQDNFTTPGGLAIVNNRVYITDIWKSKVYVYNLDGQKMLEFGSNGTDKGYFRYPNGVTADSKGNIYVSDSGNNRVQVFNKEGRFLRDFSGTSIAGVEARFASPRGIAVLDNDLLFVVNSMSSQIWISNSKGQLYNRFGDKGDENNQFNFPNGIKFSKNRLYITDTQNHGIKVFAY